MASVASVFEELDVAASLWEAGRWREIYERTSPSLFDIELEHGVEDERLDYNASNLIRAAETGRSVVSQRGGYSDLFVPIRSGRVARAALVTGPYATSRPTAEQLRSRFRALTGRSADLSDPDFSHFVRGALGTLVLDRAGARDFKRLVELVSSLAAGDRDPERVIASIDSIRADLRAARLAERMWGLTQDLVDPRTTRRWQTRNRVPNLQRLGLARVPERVVAGLFVHRDPSLDPLEGLLRSDDFQRSVVQLARGYGGTAGRIGQRGVILILPASASEARTRGRLEEVVERVATLARRKFSLNLHAGIASAASLPEQYENALFQAENALSEGLGLGRSRAPIDAGPYALRRQLGSLMRESPALVPARFEHYAHAVSAHAHHRMDLTQAHLDAGFERLLETAEEHGIFGNKALARLSEEIQIRASGATTIESLVAEYTRGVDQIVGAALDPKPSPRDKNLARAEEYLRRHFAEPVTLARVAREAGLARTYFSTLFRRKMGTSFARFVTDLRIQRARHLLGATPHSVARVARLSGFRSPEYLSRVFKRATGDGPAEYRRRIRGTSPILEEPTRRAK